MDSSTFLFAKWVELIMCVTWHLFLFSPEKYINLFKCKSFISISRKTYSATVSLLLSPKLSTNFYAIKEIFGHISGNILQLSPKPLEIFLSFVLVSILTSYFSGFVCLHSFVLPKNTPIIVLVYVNRKNMNHSKTMWSFVFDQKAYSTKKNNYQEWLILENRKRRFA